MHRESDSEVYYYAHDHLYSVVALIDDSGNVVERYEYDAYGTVHIMDASYNSRTTSSYGNPYTFTGRRLDVLDNGNKDIYYYRERYYGPYVARFYQQDPRGINPAGRPINRFGALEQYGDGMSLYEYIRSDPVKQNDPLGLSTKFWICYRMTNTSPKLPAHAYVYHGTVPWGKKPGGEGRGFSGGTQSSREQTFNPYKCRKCRHHKTRWRKLKYGSGKGKRCKCVTESEIWACIVAYPPKRKYSMPFYICLHWAEEAKKNCCLKCSWISTKAP